MQRLKMILFFVVALFPAAIFCKGLQGYFGFPNQIEANNDKEVLSSCKYAKITKIGCYSDHMDTPRPLPELVLSNRDPSSGVFDGHIFDWEKPVQSMQDLACRCARKVLQKNYTHFSLQFFGECWSGKNSASTYSNDGPSKSCLGKEYKDCDGRSDTPCTGVNFSNYVYKAESIRPTVPPTEDSNCVDQYSICKHYASINLCNNKFPLVLKYCRRSCNLC
ncbi:uncharacterized protein LOC116294312 [Actinia tenebrosa]|uniref:Uncharacterized protein LOC116294312 n=1 Tax=Actinia tenebrosa TaxID=6105 RepID=A0A6P8HQA9_ACTTE|nr:uncharacterized protein LOC116294312 [Actinia tenebrosa]